MKYRHGSLFSGIGGFDLAAEWAGFENVFQVEIDKFCQKVLSKNFPNTEKFYDIYDFKGKKYRGTIDIISGGFPCQPFSLAGTRRGKSDERHLFPQMLRVIAEVRPAWVIAENVYGLLNIENGLVFEEVCAELERNTYEVQAFIIPAAGVNAPHKRDRVWIIAYSDRNRKSILAKRSKEKREYEIPTFADASSKGLQGRQCEKGTRQCRFGNRIRNEKVYNPWNQNWLEVAAELCGVDDGLPVKLGEFKLSKSGHRIEQLKAYGNAIVPQVAFEIFKAIRETESARCWRQGIGGKQ